MQAYSSEMYLEEGKEKLGRALSSHALRSMWSGIKAQQNGMKELIPSTVRYRNCKGGGCQGKSRINFIQPQDCE